MSKPFQPPVRGERPAPPAVSEFTRQLVATATVGPFFRDLLRARLLRAADLTRAVA